MAAGVGIRGSISLWRTEGVVCSARMCSPPPSVLAFIPPCGFDYVLSALFRYLGTPVSPHQGSKVEEVICVCVSFPFEILRICLLAQLAGARWWCYETDGFGESQYPELELTLVAT